jgi:hypothetical protein
MVVELKELVLLVVGQAGELVQAPAVALLEASPALVPGGQSPAVEEVAQRVLAPAWGRTALAEEQQQQAVENHCRHHRMPQGQRRQ